MIFTADAHQRRARNAKGAVAAMIAATAPYQPREGGVSERLFWQFHDLQGHRLRDLAASGELGQNLGCEEACGRHLAEVEVLVAASAVVQRGDRHLRLLQEQPADDEVAEAEQ